MLSLYQVFLFFAIIGSVILFIKFLLSIFDLDHDLHYELDADYDTGGDASFVVISIQTIASFFAMFGVTGLALLLGTNWQHYVVAIIAVGAGLFTMVVLSVILQSVKKLEADGTTDFNKAIGLVGKVYMNIPPAETGSGTVTVILNGTQHFLEAMTKDLKKIRTGEQAKVIDRVNNVLYVTREEV